jgi:hypothetical protein
MSKYPILVRHLAGKRALTIICEACSAEEAISVDNILNEGVYACPAACGGSAVMKYEQGDECRGCDRLGFWTSENRSPIYGYCSRRCKLQAEYSDSLRRRS